MQTCVPVEKRSKKAQRAAVYFYLFKMARVPGKIGFAVGLMLIMDIFGNYPYLFPIMVTGWLAMQACSKMVTGSADLKY